MHTYQTALALAKLRSEEARCTQHVNAVIPTTIPAGEEPKIAGYVISDWCDGTTVKSFYNGRELS